MKKILMLYAEVMPYNIAAYRALINCRPDVEIDLVSYGSDKKITTYEPPVIERINFYKESKITFKDLIELYNKNKYPLVYVCGRMEKKYLDFCLFIKRHYKNVTIIGQTDEQYVGDLKQLIVKILSKFLYKRYFDLIFVPGFFQYEYMRHIGFKKSQILLGAYTANVKPFNEFYLEKKNSKKGNLTPLKLLFLGRLEKEKGISQLLNVISELNGSLTRKINIRIIGSGSLLPLIKLYDFVDYHQFASQEKIITLLDDIDFFILPSIYEPWGVVIHEMAAAGMPIICSDSCGARSAMVINNYNGYIFKTRNDIDLKKVLINAGNLGEDRINQFSKRSYELSKSITPEIWAETVSFLI